MKKGLWSYCLLAAAILSLVFLVACSKKQVKPNAAADTEISGDAQAADRARGAEDDIAEARLRAERMAREGLMNEDILFEFDKSRLVPEAKDVLKKKAEWLSQNPATTVTIEGHCDERGTNEYNLALGERRATSALEFLKELGISPDRLTPVSYGEERPLEPGHNEEAWTKNRRDHFDVK
ncbi:MAG: peptidoglycan-associated lipoprotein Pal [Pseudomonadota bacterium]